MKFYANEVSADFDEYDILIIYFGSDEHYLMIQYQEEHDDQDVEAGMDTYHIERDDQAYGGYGGVKNWTLTEDSLLIELDDTGGKNLESGNIEVNFNIRAELLTDLREKLQLALS